MISEHNVYQIEVQQGTLGPNGEIIDKPQWKKNLQISGDTVSSNPKISKYYVETVETEEENKDNFRKEIHYTEFYKNDMVYTVTYEQNTVYLDNLHVPKGQLLTGLKFAQAGDDL